MAGMRLHSKNQDSPPLADWHVILARLDGAYSESTLRAYRADIQTFVNWCRTNGHSPFPAKSTTVAEFIDAETRKCSSSTIRRRLAAIRKLHRLMGYHNPGEDEEVLIARRRAFRKNPTRPRQALGLNVDLKSKILAACPNTLAGMRDKALLATGYDTLCRRSELVALRVEDICEHPGGGAQILVRRSKNDPYGNGRTAFLSEATLKLIKAWLKKAEIKQGPIFRSIRGSTISRQELYPDSVNRILKNAAKQAGCSTEMMERLSGHSMRIGAAQDMITEGMSLLPIMRAGGWRTVSVVARYTESADIVRIMKSRRPTTSRA